MPAIDERLEFGELIHQPLIDSRRGKNTQFPFADLLQQSVCSHLAGYVDLNDAEKFWERGVPLISRLRSFETETLVQEESFAGLTRPNPALTGRAEAMDYRF